MPTPTTFRAEIEKSGTPVNRRQILLFRGTSAGTNPQNPIQRGLGITMEVVTTTAATLVTARNYYMPDDGEVFARAIAFAQVTPGRWIASGAAGGTLLGFPSGLNYTVPQPFEVEVTVFYPGGRDVQRYGFWVGDGDHQAESECATRESFSVHQEKCCYNGQGFRSAANQALFAQYLALTELGLSEVDVRFGPGQEPDGGNWGIGLPPGAGISLECITEEDAPLQGVYIPDSVSGVVSDPAKPDDPFVNPTSAPPAAGVDATRLLAPRQQLDTVVDRSTHDLPGGAYAGTSQRPAPPWWPGASPYAALADTQVDTILKPMGDREPARRPHSRSSGRVRGDLRVQWLTAGHVNSTGLAYEESVEVLDPTMPSPVPAAHPGPHLQFSITGMDPGERAYFWCSAVRNTHAGPAGIIDQIVDQQFAILLTRLTSGGGPGSNHKHQLGVAGSFATSGGPSPTFPLLPRTVSGTTIWSLNTPGGFATIGASGALTFSVLADVAYMRAVANNFILASQADFVDAYVTLYFQGVVCRPGTFPTATVSMDPWGVDWPHNSWLTSVATLRLRREPSG